MQEPDVCGYCEMCVECTGGEDGFLPPLNKRLTKADIDALDKCLICHSPALAHASGCAHCMACGWSVCG